MLVLTGEGECNDFIIVGIFHHSLIYYDMSSGSFIELWIFYYC